MMPNPWFLVAVLIALAGAAYGGYREGVKHEQGRAAIERESALSEQADALRKHYENQKNVEVVYRDRIKTIKEAADPSGCADADIAADIINSLRGESLGD